MAIMDKNTPIGVKAMAGQTVNFPEINVQDEAAENKMPDDFSAGTEQAEDASGAPSEE